MIGHILAIMIAIAVGYGIYRLIKARVADGSIELPGHDSQGKAGAGGSRDDGGIPPASA